MGILDINTGHLNKEVTEFVQWCENIYTKSQSRIDPPPELKHRDMSVDGNFPRGQYSPLFIYYSAVFQIPNHNNEFTLYQQVYSQYFSDDASILRITNPQGYDELIQKYIRGLRRDFDQCKPTSVHPYASDIFHASGELIQNIMVDLDYRDIVMIEIFTSDLH